MELKLFQIRVCQHVGVRDPVISVSSDPVPVCNKCSGTPQQLRLFRQHYLQARKVGGLKCPTVSPCAWMLINTSVTPWFRNSSSQI